jgi:G3E family GTPase
VRLIYIAGMEGVGKTSLIVSMLAGRDTSKIGAMANNDLSRKMLSEYCKANDCYPLRTPCARPRQLSFRMWKLVDANNLDIVISEPPGICRETAAPILNRLFAFEREKVDIAPLITVVDGSMLKAGVPSKDTTNELLLFNQIFESDIVVVHKSDLFDEYARSSIASTVSKINSDAETIFTSSRTGDGVATVAEAAFSDRKYQRPLVN